ncbi:MAG: hypothetical protein LUD22_04065 [Coprobacillus sp.]|nr:hypothetical protein [Coprobacillus sp.]
MEHMYDDISIKEFGLDIGKDFIPCNKFGKVLLNLGEKILKVFSKDDGIQNYFAIPGKGLKQPIFCLSEDGTKYTIHGIRCGYEITGGYYYKLDEVLENDFIEDWNYKTNDIIAEFNIFDIPGPIPTFYKDHISNYSFKYGDDKYKISIAKEESTTKNFLTIEEKSAYKEFEIDHIFSIIELIFLYIGTMPSFVKIEFKNNGQIVKLYTRLDNRFNVVETLRINKILKDVNNSTINGKVLEDFEKMKNSNKKLFNSFLMSLSEIQEEDVRLNELIQNFEPIYDSDENTPKNKWIKAKDESKKIDLSFTDKISFYVDVFKDTIGGIDYCNHYTPIIFKNDVIIEKCLPNKFVNHRNGITHLNEDNSISEDEVLSPTFYRYYEQKLILCLRILYLERTNKPFADTDKDIIEEITSRIENRMLPKDLEKPSSKD